MDLNRFTACDVATSAILVGEDKTSYGEERLWEACIAMCYAEMTSNERKDLKGPNVYFQVYTRSWNCFANSSWTRETKGTRTDYGKHDTLSGAINEINRLVDNKVKKKFLVLDPRADMHLTKEVAQERMQKMVQAMTLFAGTYLDPKV